MLRNTHTLLVVEDEPKIADVTKSFLESKGFVVLVAENGTKALEIFDKESISLILLDLMLPDMSGEEICTNIRKKSRVPIIMLTAKVSEEDMLIGLNLGADDYITKPFSLKALHARVEAVLRRYGDDNTPLYNKTSLRGGDLEIDFDAHCITKNKTLVNLTPNEYKILITLLKHPNKVFTRDELISSAFGDTYEGFDRTIDSHIKNIRQKIESDFKNPVYILTVYGVGYKFGGD